MQKYLLYRKGLRIADIDRNDFKHGAQRAFSEWIAREQLLLDEKMEEREVFTFRLSRCVDIEKDMKALATGFPSRPTAPILKKMDII